MTDCFAYLTSKNKNSPSKPAEAKNPKKLKISQSVGFFLALTFCLCIGSLKSAPASKLVTIPLPPSARGNANEVPSCKAALDGFKASVLSIWLETLLTVEELSLAKFEPAKLEAAGLRLAKFEFAKFWLAELELPKVELDLPTFEMATFELSAFEAAAFERAELSSKGWESGCTEAGFCGREKPCAAV